MAERLEGRTLLHGVGGHDHEVFGHMATGQVPWAAPLVEPVIVEPSAYVPDATTPPLGDVGGSPARSLAPRALPSSVTWRTVRNVPSNRAEGAKFVANGRLYTFGGFIGPRLAVNRQVDVYNPATNTWSRAADTPDAITHAATAVDPVTGLVWVGTFFLRNGVSSSRLVYTYNPRTNTWGHGPSLPQARGAGGMAIVGRELHAWGGLDANGIGRREHWRLNLDNPRAGWVADTLMPEDVNHMGGVALGGRIYSIGGIHDKVENTSNRTTVRVYDPATRQWTSGTPLPFGMGHIGPDTYSDGRQIVIAGGQINGTGERLTAAVLRYDPGTRRWSSLASLPRARKSAAVGIINNQIIVANGNINTSPYISNTTYVGS